MKRKLLSLLLVGAMSATMFAGCGNGGTDTNAPADDASNTADGAAANSEAPVEDVSSDSEVPEDDASGEPQTLKVAVTVRICGQKLQRLLKIHILALP